MIILDDKTKVKKIYVPKPINTDEVNITFKATGEIDKQTYTTVLYDNVEFVKKQLDYYCFELFVPEWPEQEYKYELFNSYNKFLGSGLLRIGTPKHKNSNNTSIL